MNKQNKSTILEMVSKMRDDHEKPNKVFDQNDLRLMTRTYRREKEPDKKSAGSATPL